MRWGVVALAASLPPAIPRMCCGKPLACTSELSDVAKQTEEHGDCLELMQFLQILNKDLAKPILGSGTPLHPCRSILTALASLAGRKRFLNQY